ncbi:MAG: HlyD family efflux transporter periplasmic adaptor subunit [Desulfobulbus sp.]|nr:HlyD family efflux transporter periplasmic adaptor subunit [Desulfobulbus sp.]
MSVIMHADTALPDAVATALEARARRAVSLEELTFSIANDAFTALPFRQALVLDDTDGSLLAISGLARIGEDTPYVLWLRRLWPWLKKQSAEPCSWLTLEEMGRILPADLREGWEEWWPIGVCVLALTDRAGDVLGWVCFLLENPPSPVQKAILQRVAQTWGYCWEMLAARHSDTWRSRLKRVSRFKWLTVAALIVLSLIPVRQSVLAPAEVISLDTVVVASPLDGVIKSVHVRPNQPVKSGQPLFSLDDTTLRSRREIVQKAVAVADAELLAATQKAFDTPQGRSSLALLSGRAQEKRAELAAIQAQLHRVDITAERDGVVVFSDPDDWIGRPVSTGERIMQLANPEKPGVLIHVPAAEAVAFEVNAPARLFLTVDPLHPLQAVVSESSFQAVVSPAGVAGYRLRAEFTDAVLSVRLGLRGTAKIYGERVPLVYVLLRRPLATLREWTGW